MTFIRFDYDYYIETESGIGFSEKSRDHLRTLLYDIQRKYDGFIAFRKAYPEYLTAGPWELRVNNWADTLIVGIVGTPRALFTLNPYALKSMSKRVGNMSEAMEVCCNSIDSKLSQLALMDLIPYVDRDLIPEYILDVDSKKIFKTDSYDRKKGCFTKEAE